MRLAAGLLSLSFLLLPGLANGATPDARMNLTPFGQLSVFGDHDEATALSVDALRAGGSANVGVEWREERDLNEIRVRFAGKAPSRLAVAYWFHTWPFEPPVMPSIEDPVDDRWQGRWLTAAVKAECRETECTFRFAPLAETENPNARHQPGLTYRRTLKVRLNADGPMPPILALETYSGTTEKLLSIRLGFGFREPDAAIWSGSIEVSNGRVQAVKPWRFGKQDRIAADRRWTIETSGGDAKGLDVELITAVPMLPGSLDDTLVTARASVKTGAGTASRTFTFRIADLRQGPIYIPHLHAYATTNLSNAAFTPPTGRGERIRAMIPREPEQSYERASKEIPPLDPWTRQWPGPLYLPLAADASWQKFAFEIGGNPFISKHGTKAMGNELKRLQWEGDELKWRIGTGQKPYYREDKQAAMSVLDGYLPVVTQKWTNDGFDYEEEAFATLLRGPLDAGDPQRSEQTPAVLLITLRFRNTTNAPRTAHLWLDTAPAETLEVRGEGLYAAGNRLRALVQGATMSLDALPGGSGKAGHVAVPVAAGASGTVVLKLPFVSDLGTDDIAAMSRLDAATERTRVTAYWRNVTAEALRFAVPEPDFNQIIRGVVAHIRISATKDPITGLLMLPAASYIYKVYANETCFQTLLLDSLGQHKLAEAYLEPILRFQGTRGFPGKHKGMEDAIFHGLRVNDEYDYTASTYGLDNGTVLWTLGEHYLYTRDRAWFEHAWPHIRKTVDWIVAQRHSTMRTDADGKPVPEYGLLPASSLEDNSDWAHWFANNSFSWAGLDRVARALEDLNYPEAAAVRKEADAYREDLRRAVLRATEAASVTKLRDGTYIPWVPVEPYQRLRRFGPIRVDYYKRYGITEQPNLRLSAIREVLYGPIILLNLGVFGVDEPIAGWILDDWEDNMTLTSGLGLNVHGLTDDKLWFSQGGMVFQSNLQNPWLVYLKRQEAPFAIRCAYNNFRACFYPGPNVFTEEYRAWSNASGPFYKSPDESKFVNRLRDMLVLEGENSLWLAGGIPRRWLASAEGVRVDRVTTYFGDVSYWLRAVEPGVIEGEVTLPSRNPARENWLIMRVPQGKIAEVTIDGQPWTGIDTAREAIRLPDRPTTMSLRIRYR